jgi:hypothetical protein
MAEEGADALIELRANDVLELAGLRMHFGFVDGKSIFEQALGEAVAADDVASALGAYRCKLRFSVSKIDEMQIRHAPQNLCSRFG